jgi:hypothetical protein
MGFSWMRPGGGVGLSPGVSLLVGTALLVTAPLLQGCGGGEGSEKAGGGSLAGDSLAESPGGRAGATDSPGGRDTTFLSVDGDPAALSGGCAPDAVNPGRIRLTAEWRDGHVRVTGSVEGGAGNALTLGLSHGDKFIFSEIFKSDLLSVISLDSDSLDATTVSHEPSAGERTAFARTGAVPLDPARPVCLDVSLYEKGSLDLLAVRHLPVASSTPAATE